MQYIKILNQIHTPFGLVYNTQISRTQKNPRNCYKLNNVGDLKFMDGNEIHICVSCDFTHIYTCQLCESSDSFFVSDLGDHVHKIEIL